MYPNFDKNDIESIEYFIHQTGDYAPHIPKKITNTNANKALYEIIKLSKTNSALYFGIIDGEHIHHLNYYIKISD